MKSWIAKIVVVAVLTGILTMDAERALAKAAYQSKGQMIDCCEVIAIVDVQKVEKVAEKACSARTYSQRATAVPVRVLKGKLPNPATIYGGEDFICAQCNFQPGKLLVFLNHDGNLLIGSNWHLSVRPIKSDMLDWYDSADTINLKPTNLKTVMEQIETQLGNDPKLTKLHGDLKELSQAHALCDREVGDSNKPSKIWQAYKNAVATVKPEQKDLLWSMFKNSTPAGRIYAAMLMHRINKEEGKRALAMLGCCNATVEYVSGCEVRQEGIWLVASNLYSKSKHLNISLEG